MAKKKIVSRSNEERIIRVWDIEQIKDLMVPAAPFMRQTASGRRSFRDLWVQLPENQKTASFGRNWGYYVGMDEIKRYYVTQYNEQVQAEIAALPDVDVPGTGRFLFHPLSTPNVTLAEDGKTARHLVFHRARTATPPRTEPPIAAGTARRSARTSSRSQAAGRYGTWCSPMTL